MLAVGYVLEPRPTNAVENEDDDENDSPSEGGYVQVVPPGQG
jgi:hypothetical protein